MDGVWLQKLIDYGWMLILVVAEAVRRLYARVGSAESRLNIIEGNHDERTRQINEINVKIDRLGDSVDTKLNMIISKLIDRVPPA